MREEVDNNLVGDSGEGVVKSIFDQFSFSNKDAKCTVQILEQKWPVIDLFVQYKRRDNYFFFFLQAKSTIVGPQGEKDDELELKVKLEREDHEKIASFVGPTYLVGVDNSGGPLSRSLENPKAYLRTIRDKAEKGIYSVPVSKKHELTMDNVQKLLEEVATYWENIANNKGTYTSNFTLNETTGYL